MLYEFENSYNLNTGDLLQIFYGSGIHLQKDVSLSFSFIDPQGNIVNNDLELRNNPLIKNISYDILDINRNTLYENYQVGLTRTFTLKEIDNIALFGEYKKDFGIRAIVSNFINDNEFISEYYLYGNTPIISNVLVNDASGVRKYTSPSIYENISTGIIYDKIELNIEFLNNPQYIIYDYIDIYASYSNDLEIIDENFIYRYSLTNNSQALKINLEKNYLPVGKYNLAIVPYSKIGSGEAFYIEEINLNASPEIILEQSDIQKDSVGEIILRNGENLSKTNLITGIFINKKDEIIDIINKDEYKIIKYTTQIIDNNKISSSELKIIINSEDFMTNPSLIEYGFGDSNFINYRLEAGDSDIYLIANGANIGAFYKLYKISM